MRSEAGSRPLAVTQIISAGGLYGAERVLLELGSHVQSLGWASRIVLLQSPGAALVDAAARKAGIPVEIMDGGPLSLAAALKRHATQYAVDVIHSHGYRPDVAVALIRGVPGLRRVSTCHTWYRESLKMRVYEELDKLALRRFDHVVGVSPELEQELLRCGFSKDRVSYVRNGMDFDLAPATIRDGTRESVGAQPGDFLVLRVGRLSAAKGNSCLLRAMAGLPEGLPWRLALVGEGEEAAALRDEAARLGVAPRVHFAGYRQDIGALLAAADAFVISSTQEGLPMVLLEAMACGRPIVSTAVGAIPEVVKDGFSALLVKPDDRAGMTQALARLHANPGLASELGANAKAMHASTYSRESMGSKYADIYRAVCQAAS